MTIPTLTARLAPHWPSPFDAQLAVLLLHGYGSNEHDLAGLAPHVTSGQPWASLRAPLDLAPGSHAWFQIVTPGNPSPEAVAAGTDAVWSWVDAHLPAGMPILPVGFSQGGLMASELLRTRPERVPGIALLSGFIQGAPRPGDDTLAVTRPPVFWGRGDTDTVITPAAVERTRGWLPNHARLQERVYPGLAHAINAEEAAEVRAFISALTPNPA